METLLLTYMTRLSVPLGSGSEPPPRPWDRSALGRRDNNAMSEEPQEVAVTRFTSGPTDVAVYEFQGKTRDLLLKSLNEAYLSTGRYAPDEHAVSPQGMMSLITAGTAAGATSVSATLAPTLFVATANPATLMHIGAGLSTAVLGSGGIVAHAPFIPVAATLPVLAPLMAVHVLTVAMTMQQFQQVNKKLDSIKKTLDEVIARTEATHVGELITASKSIDEIAEQFAETGSFSLDMTVRLAIAERDVRRLAERYSYLVNSQKLADVEDVTDVRQLNYDAHSALLASFLGLRIAQLRVGINMQDNPAAAVSAHRRLKDTIANGITLWETLLHRSEQMRIEIGEIQEHFNDQPWLQKHIPEFVGGRGHAQAQRISALKDGYVAMLEDEKAIMEGFYSLIQSSKDMLTQLENPRTDSANAPALVYWDDENGRHSFTTDTFKIS